MTAGPATMPLGRGSRVQAASPAPALFGLPLHHRDRFDRLLVAQALVEGLTLVTANPALQNYDTPDPASHP